MMKSHGAFIYDCMISLCCILSADKSFGHSIERNDGGSIDELCRVGYHRIP